MIKRFIFPFLVFCFQISIAQEASDSVKSNKVYAKLTFDYGVKCFAPVDMTNSELTGGSLSVENDPSNSDNQIITSTHHHINFP